IPGVGMSGSALISLDTADQGLSGYIFSIFPENPQVAKITGVAFPEWASLSEATPGDGAAYTIRALDLNDAIGYHAQSVPLATLNLQGITSGSTRIMIEVRQLDDDNGKSVDAQLTPGQVTVVNGGGDQDINLQLVRGWNFVSIPMTLLSGSNTAEIFKDVPSGGHSIFSYDPVKGWSIVGRTEPLTPMNAYWIYTEQALSIPLKIQGPAVSPKSLSSGWNIIGISGRTPVPAADALRSLSDWTYVIGFDAAGQQYQQPIIRGGSGQHSDQTPLVPGAGYWIHLSVPGQLNP
ncbi:MAG: hypothetical protein LUQ50_02665, partial [Methanospirillum sp.]|uniref:hypothetical protein n=1 Tax=Methanospirillum sp. TaxID=45200 RepID=UPI0023758F12